MRRLVGIGVRLAVLWCAWWVLAALGVHLAVPRLVASQPGAEATLAGVGGFPGRFAIGLSDVHLADPAADWQADAVQITARAWNPVHVDLILPPEHKLRLGAERITLRTGANRGELALLPIPSLPFKGFALRLQDAAVESNRGWDAGAARAVVDIWPGEPAQSFDVVADIAGLTLSPDVKRQIDPAGVQERVVEALALDATAGFDGPWNRYALDGPRPQPTSLDLRTASLTWGDISLSATGSLTIDAAGVPDGAIRINTPDWRRVFDFAVANQMILPEDAGTWETALSVLALGGEALEVPISFQNGFMAIGPVPAGPAPVIRIP